MVRWQMLRRASTSRSKSYAALMPTRAVTSLRDDDTVLRA